MDSGDLGYRANSEVYITGREKDTIIKGGHNISPQEIENAAAEVRGVRRGCVAAFGISDQDTGTERLIVVAETRTRDRAELNRIGAEVIRVVGQGDRYPARPGETRSAANDSKDFQWKDPPQRDPQALRGR